MPADILNIPFDDSPEPRHWFWWIFRGPFEPPTSQKDEKHEKSESHIPNVIFPSTYLQLGCRETLVPLTMDDITVSQRHVCVNRGQTLALDITWRTRWRIFSTFFCRDFSLSGLSGNFQRRSQRCRTRGQDKKNDW